MSQEVLGKDVTGEVDFSLPKPISCWDEPLVATVVSTITTPAGFNRAFFSFAVGTNVWATYDGTTPVIPVTGAATKQELNPGIRQININGGDIIKVISDTASFINIRYDQGQQ